MSIPLPSYTKIKDNYCIAYYGNCKEYIVQLKLLRPLMNSKFPGINIYLTCKDDFFYLLEEEKLTFPKSGLRTQEFAYVREISCDMESHPIEEFMKESSIPCGPVAVPEYTGDGNCVIYPHACLPTRSLTGGQIRSVINIAEKMGYKPIIDGPLDDAEWVVGVENEQVFLGAAQGRKSSLIPTGFGENLFKNMFPKCQILNVNHI